MESDAIQAEQVIPAVPKPYIQAYPKGRQDRIWTIRSFIAYVRAMQGL